MKYASTGVLHKVFNVILLILLVRALNVLTVKIVDRSEHNAVSGALVRLLHECLGYSVLGGKYCMLVVR